MERLPAGAERFQKDLLQWSRGNLREFPWREEDRTPFEILVAEIFLKQTRASTVADIYPAFMSEYPGPEALQEASKEEIIELIRPLGLYNHRADALKEIGKILGGSEVPSTRGELLELPQVGPYVANATLCFGFGENVPIVDSNIRRVYTRLFYWNNNDVSDSVIWDLARRILPEDEAQRFNLALLDFGARICTDTSPHCEQCFAQSYCGYYLH